MCLACIRHSTWTSVLMQAKHSNEVIHKSMDLSEVEMKSVSQATSHFKYYSWFNDLPWYFAPHFSSMLQRMGGGHNESCVTLLWKIHKQYGHIWIFEQLIYQYWTVVQYGFSFDLITSQIDGSINEVMLSFMRSNLILNQKAVTQFAATLPLWIACDVRCIFPSISQGEPLFSFHHGRCNLNVRWHKCEK